MFFTDEEDFALSGPIPLSFERTWYSNSGYEGPLGNGWHHAYDMAIIIEKGKLSFRTNDGRAIAFDIPNVNAPTFLRSEQIEAYKNEDSTYYIHDIKEDLYYYFEKKSDGDIRKLTKIIDRNGFSIQFKYNGLYLNQIIDSAHRTLNVKNDKEGRVTSISTIVKEQENPLELATYTYDTSGNLIKQTNAVGDSMLFEYEGRLMVKETWRDGMNWFFRFDGTEVGSRCIHTWGDGDIYNHKLKFINEGTTEVEDSLGNITIYHHKNGLVYHKIDPVGSEFKSHYNQFNELISETDPLGNNTFFEYNDKGLLLASADAEGGSIEIEYTNDRLPHLPTQITDKRGGKWKLSYNEQGNTIRRTNPNGAKSSIKYKDGLPVEVINTEGKSTLLHFDHEYNLNTIISATQAKTELVYDSLGRQIKTTNPNGAVQTIGYDKIGRAIKINDFDGNLIELEYDGIDNLIQYKDKQRTANYKYKGLWKLTSRSEGGKTVQFRYNTEEQLKRVINEQGLAYKFTLDEAGNVLKEEGFDRATRNYTRNKAGQVKETILPSGKKIEYQYNNLGQVTGIEYEDGSFDKYTYDSSGLLQKAENKDGLVEIERDVLGNIIAEQVNGKWIKSSYNDIGRRTNIQSSLGANISFNIDEFGNLEQLKALQNADAGEWKANFQYDKLGLEIERKLSGIISTTNRDTLGRIKEQSTTGHGNKKQKKYRRYQWGINDRLHSIMDSDNGTTEYGYDNRGYLTDTKYEGGEKEWRKPDAVGNLFNSPDQTDREYAMGGKLMRKGA